MKRFLVEWQLLLKERPQNSSMGPFQENPMQTSCEAANYFIEEAKSKNRALDKNRCLMASGRNRRKGCCKILARKEAQPWWKCRQQILKTPKDSNLFSKNAFRVRLVGFFIFTSVCALAGEGGSLSFQFCTYLQYIAWCEVSSIRS